VGVGVGVARGAAGALARGWGPVADPVVGRVWVGVGAGTVLTTGGGVAGRVTVEPGLGARLKVSSPGIKLGVGVGVGAGALCAHTGATTPTETINGSVIARTWRAANLVIIPTQLP
jgi:hypothetical protein